MSEPKICTKCSQSMVLGLVADRFHLASVGVSHWVKARQSTRFGQVSKDLNRRCRSAPTNAAPAAFLNRTLRLNTK
jgi:hypothetical protein